MILSDTDIKLQLELGELQIEPIARNAIQPASIDLRLGPYIRVFDKNTKLLDLYNLKPHTHLISIENSSYTLKPSEFILGVTLERVKIPNFLVARLEGRSSLGRLGLSVHSTAGYIDPGFDGTLTLEILNSNTIPIVLYPQAPIAQLSLIQLTSPCSYPYGSTKLKSKYQFQIIPTECLYYA
jgi:dCTP deaminase